MSGVGNNQNLPKEFMKKAEKFLGIIESAEKAGNVLSQAYSTIMDAREKKLRAEGYVAEKLGEIENARIKIERNHEEKMRELQTAIGEDDRKAIISAIQDNAAMYRREYEQYQTVEVLLNPEAKENLNELRKVIFEMSKQLMLFVK